MSDSATITREQLRTVYVATELGGKDVEANHFSYAGLAKALIHSASCNSTSAITIRPALF